MITNDVINTFFNNLPSVLKQDVIKKTIEKDEEGTRTNILYLTTRCDFKCEYCYELESREDLTKGVDTTEEDIDHFLQEIFFREKDYDSSVVLFGGEPFLRYDLVEYTILKAISLKKKYPFNFNIISNGKFLSNEKNCHKVKNLIEFAKLENCEIKITISYDESGHSRRITQKGEATYDIVHQAFYWMRHYQIPYEISYTIHAGNYNNIVTDIKKICQTLSPSRIKLSWAFSDIDAVTEAEYGFKLKEKYEAELIEVFNKYNKPICHMVCDYCDECDFSTHKGNSYMSPTKGLLYSEAKTTENFNLF